MINWNEVISSQLEESHKWFSIMVRIIASKGRNPAMSRNHCDQLWFDLKGK
jgi:hypothetical protein